MLVYLDILAFYVAVERVLAPRLRGRPVLVAPPSSSRAPVLDVSAEAWQAGVRKGMPLGRARRVCRDAWVLPPRPELYERASGDLRDRLSRFSPRLEPAGPGHFVLDVAGTDRLFGPPRDAAARMQRELARDTSLAPAVGVAANKLVSRVAARVAKPAGLREVEPGSERAFLDPLPVDLLPGVGSVALERLHELNCLRIRELAALTRDQLLLAFGTDGPTLHQKARGIDASPVLPAGDEPPAVTESWTPDEDTNDDGHIEAALADRLGLAAYRLRARGLQARTVEVAILYSDGTQVARRRALPSPSDLDLDLGGPALRLLREVYTRRIRLRKVDVTLSHLVPPDGQLPLFEPDPRTRPRRALFAALDRLRVKYGWPAISFGRARLEFGRAPEEPGLDRCQTGGEVQRSVFRNPTGGRTAGGFGSSP